MAPATWSRVLPPRTSPAQLSLLAVDVGIRVCGEMSRFRVVGELRLDSCVTSYLLAPQRCERRDVRKTQRRAARPTRRRSSRGLVSANSLCVAFRSTGLFGSAMSTVALRVSGASSKSFGSEPGMTSPVKTARVVSMPPLAVRFAFKSANSVPPGIFSCLIKRRPSAAGALTVPCQRPCRSTLCHESPGRGVIAVAVQLVIEVRGDRDQVQCPLRATVQRARHRG